MHGHYIIITIIDSLWPVNTGLGNAWRHQAIICTNVELSSVVSNDNHAISQHTQNIVRIFQWPVS